MIQQLHARQSGETRAQTCLIRLLCAVSIWRTLMTRVLPLCGAAAWWVGLVCLLPGFAVAALWRAVMARNHAATLTEAVRASLGRFGAVLLSLTLAALLLVDGVSAITALITLFTEGLGTRGTQFTLAALTGIALLFSLHREGLARAAVLLRWGMLAAALLLAAFLLPGAKADHLFPLYGEGTVSVLTALKAGASLGWPVTLLLTVEPMPGRSRLAGAVLPSFAAVAALLLLSLTVPQELLTRQEGMAALLLLPTRYAPNALRVVAMCLIMLTFFLSIGAAAQLGTAHLCMPWSRVPAWLPYALLAAMFLSQTASPARLWELLACAEPWLLAPLAVLAILSLIRRKKS